MIYFACSLLILTFAYYFLTAIDILSNQNYFAPYLNTLCKLHTRIRSIYFLIHYFPHTYIYSHRNYTILGEVNSRTYDFISVENIFSFLFGTRRESRVHSSCIETYFTAIISRRPRKYLPFANIRVG